MVRESVRRASLAFLIILLIPAYFSLFRFVSLRMESDRLSRINSAPVIGIDFGDSHTRVAVKINGTVRVLGDAAGERSIPSYGAFTEKGTLFGQAAKNYLKVRPDQVVSDFRRLLGRSFEEIKDDHGHNLYEVVEKDGIPKIRVHANREYSIEEVMALFLAGVKDFAEEALGQEIIEAVVGVPAYLEPQQGDALRQSLKEAGKLAGLDIVRCGREPIFAAMAYGLDADPDGPLDGQYILIHNIGRHNQDVTILEIEDGVFEVHGHAHARGSAGTSFTRTVVGLLLEQNAKNDIVRLYEDPRHFAPYEGEFERVKHDLSFQVSDKVKVNIPGLEGTTTSSEFEASIRSMFDPTDVIEQALKDAGLVKEDIHHVVVVGCSSRIPFIRDAAQQHFGKAPVFNYTIDPAEAVAIGAAIQGAHGKDELDFLPTMNIVLSEIGVRIDGGEDVILVKLGTPIPTSKSRFFTTAYDDQQEGIIKFYAPRVALDPVGNFKDDKVEDLHGNDILGFIHLKDLPAAPRGTIQVRVTATIDYNYYLQAEATNIETGKHASLTIEKISWTGFTTQDYVSQFDIPKGGEIALLETPIRHNEL